MSSIAIPSRHIGRHDDCMLLFSTSSKLYVVVQCHLDHQLICKDGVAATTKILALQQMVY